MVNNMKKLFSLPIIILMLTISASLFVFPQNAQAECTTELNFEYYPGGQGPPTIYTGTTHIKVKDGDTYALNYKSTCDDINLSYSVNSTVDGRSTYIVPPSAFPSGGHVLDDTKTLGAAVIGKSYIYKLSVYTGNQLLSSSELTITFDAATGNTPGPSSNYTPTEVAVCDLQKNSAKICWKTASPSNSEVEFGLEGATTTVVRFTNFSLTTHSVPLSNLKVATKYRFRARSSPNANTASTTGDWLSFTTKNADGTGGDTGGTGTNNTPPIGAKGFQNYDSVTASLYNPLSANSIPELITRIIRILLLLIAMVAVVMIIVGGFRMVASSGNPAALTKAKQTIIWAVIGLVVALLSFSIVAIIQNLIQS